MAMAPGQPTNISSYIEMALLPATGGLVVGLSVELETQVVFLFTCCLDHAFFCLLYLYLCVCVFVYLCHFHFSSCICTRTTSGGVGGGSISILILLFFLAWLVTAACSGVAAS